MSSSAVAPDVAISLLLRLCFEVRPIDHVRGANMPVLMVMHVVMQLRALAGVSTIRDTSALGTYSTGLFSSATAEDVAKLPSDGLKLTEGKVDVAERVTVRCCGRGERLGRGYSLGPTSAAASGFVSNASLADNRPAEQSVMLAYAD